jgi:cystathionine beta-lyase
MKKYDFDKVTDRKNTNSLKYDFAVERGKPSDLLPLWVADMDFPTPKEVISALTKKAEHGIFGYSEPKPDYFEAIRNWYKTRHGWDMDASKLVLSCGVVYAICTLIQVLTNKGDGVIICQPVYYPFQESVVENERKLVVSELVYDGNQYNIDFDDFEQKIVSQNVKLFILCSPHNPVGRVWTKAELQRLGDICLKHNVFVIADEIHADFVYGENKHTIFCTVKPEYENMCAVCTAPTKTFNLAGLHNANIYIPNDEVRKKYLAQLNRQGYSQSNVMGIVAAQAAYTYGGEWLDELIEYLTSNLEFVDKFLKENLPQIKLIKPQGTYLIWLDCRALNLTDRQLKDLVVNKAKLWLDDGYIFGKGGSGFQRINIACPRSILAEALNRLKSAVEQL